MRQQGRSFSTSAAVNIPGLVGGGEAYVGFTEGTGGLTAIQDIISWTYTPGSSLPQVATPAISPAAGTYGSPLTVTITDGTSGATIYYTTNGSTPTTSSTPYTGAFQLTSSGTVEAIAVASGYSNSAVASAAYTVGGAAATPAISPAAGTYGSPLTVTITDGTSGATIYYTTNGSTPTTSSTPYTGAFQLTSSGTVEAIAVASGYSNSAVASAAYTVQAGASTINFSSGFAGETTLTLNGSAALNGSLLQLTNTGKDEAGSAFFSTLVSVTNFTNAFTFQDTSAKADGLCFVIEASGPTALGGDGGSLGYAGATGALSTNSLCVDFDLYNNTTYAEISNTGLFTDGASPANGAGSAAGSLSFQSGDVMSVQMSYNGTTLSWTITDATTGASFSTSAAVNIPGLVGGGEAYVGFTGGTGGLTAIQDIISWTYTPGSSLPQVATPAISPAAGTYGSPLTVTITDGTSGATIYYTTNGSTPTTSSTPYRGAFQLTSSGTVEAIAVASGYSNSAVASAAYTVGGAAATPAISPAAGTYGSPLTVTITDGTSGATIYYTTNGSTPTTSSTPYTGAFQLTSSGTVEAIAVASGYSNSAVASAAYTVQAGASTINFSSGFAGETTLTLNGSAALNGSLLQLTNTGKDEAGSAFFSTLVSVTNFTNAFTFQDTSAKADGLCFVIEASGPTALGGDGGSLGYAGATGALSTNSLCVDFDLYNNTTYAEISNTGLFTDGASPANGAGSAAGSLSFQSGDVMSVQMSYNGTTLSWTITDATTGASFSTSAAVNIPSLVGGDEAYVGFTGGTGALTAIQDIISWTYTP